MVFQLVSGFPKSKSDLGKVVSTLASVHYIFWQRDCTFCEFVPNRFCFVFVHMKKISLDEESVLIVKVSPVQRVFLFNIIDCIEYLQCVLSANDSRTYLTSQQNFSNLISHDVEC